MREREREDKREYVSMREYIYIEYIYIRVYRVYIYKGVCQYERERG